MARSIKPHIVSLYDLYDKTSFRFWERQISEGQLPTSAELKELLKANKVAQLPSWLIPILDRRDELKRLTGRPRNSALKAIQLQLAVQLYPRYLRWLKNRDRCSGLKGWPAVQDKDWWEGPPHERAARMALARAKLRYMTWSAFQNWLVKHNKPTFYE